MNTLALPYGSFWWRDMLRKAVMRIMAQRQDYGIGKAVVNDSARAYEARVTGPNVITNCHFTDPNGTLLTAYSWTDPLDVRPGLNQWVVYVYGAGGIYSIQSNQCKHITADGSVFFGIDTGAPDCTISEDVYVELVGATTAYIVYRITDANNWWIFGAEKGPNRTVLYEVTGGVVVLRATGADIASGAHTLKMVLSGSAMDGYVDDVLFLSHSSAVRATATIHGGYLYFSDPDGYIDNFMVTVP